MWKRLLRVSMCVMRFVPSRSPSTYRRLKTWIYGTKDIPKENRKRRHSHTYTYTQRHNRWENKNKKWHGNLWKWHFPVLSLCLISVQGIYNVETEVHFVHPHPYPATPHRQSHLLFSLPLRLAAHSPLYSTNKFICHTLRALQKLWIMCNLLAL